MKKSLESIYLPFTTAETVHNLSSKLLTTDELELLKYGLKHLIHPLQINKLDILTTFTFFHCATTNKLKDKHSGELKTKMLHLADSYVNAHKKHKILKRVRQNKKIVILRPDKGCQHIISKIFYESLTKVITKVLAGVLGGGAHYENF